MRKLILLILLLSPPFVGEGFAPSDSLEIVVRPTEIDVKGHVNNAKYIEYLQWSRWEWFDKQGLTNEKLKELDTVLVVVNININYRQEVLQGEKLSVDVELQKIGDKSLTLTQTVRKMNGDVAADAQVVLVGIDPSSRKSRSLPDSVRKILEKKL